MAERFSKDANHALLSLFLAVVTGCSGQPRLGEIPRGDPFFISTSAPALEKTNEVSNAAVVSDARVGAGQTELRVEISKIGLRSLGRDRISLTLSLKTVMKTTQATGKQTERGASFRYESPPAPVASWVDNYDDFITRRFEEGYLALSEDIVAALQNRAQR